ncbi:hypothetical protein JY493_23035 [Serratia marcescens]|nr:hypothetical protein [Serratia marcescens]
MKTLLKSTLCSFLFLPFLTIASVGFLSPSGVNKDFADKVDFALINVYNADQLRENLVIAKEHNLKIFLDLGPSINTARETKDINVNYHDGNGSVQKKVFTPQEKNKLRKLPEPDELNTRLNLYIPIIKEYPGTVAAIFLADEPYLNGLNKKDLELVAEKTRKILNDNNLKKIKLGVIFASAMFDRDFAKMMDGNSSKYVVNIDSHYKSIMEKKPTNDELQWVEAIKANRLTTYDSAGNLYTQGGIPKGFDIYTFDFYLSTILLDNLYENVITWLKNKNLSTSCEMLQEKTISQLRNELSFFNDGPVSTSKKEMDSDQHLLDALYQCRMETVTKLLKAEIEKTSPKAEIILISESSSNGAMEFDAQGNIEKYQPEKLVELRVLQEVQRAKKFYQDNANSNVSGIMFFLYANEYDKTIKINIGGAAGMPAVLSEIYSIKQ